MRNGHITTVLQALAISLVLAAVIGFVLSEFSWRLAIVAAILFAVIWVVMVGRSPKVQDPQQPDSVPDSR
ncbi:hypothetical protein [Dongia deserti]|uniref:hypothetical protein n=1 Tax=Dongia deserti TaxID=2268030 RepID=UPI000E659EF5|nr:hypothetical protein [Dongia deserti]